MNRLLAKIPALLLTLMVGLFASSSAFATATIVIQNNDAAGVGFNDPTVVAPVGNNAGTTVGQQRLNAFQFAANIWGATLVSGPTITINASWSSTMTCSTSTGVLGSAGTASLRGNFLNAVILNAWYPIALANALAGSDLNGPTAEINATFNSNVGIGGCLTSSHWYYGLDNVHHPGDIDLVPVLLHEFGHGLGFESFTDESTGVQAGNTPPGFPSVYDFFLLDKTTGKHWAAMTNAERQASAINTTNLVWDGPQVTTDSASALTAGKDSSGHPLMYAPGTVESGSSVSHWDKTEAPNQLMEPNINSDLTYSVSVGTNRPDLTFSLLRDVGWCAGCAQPPPPSPTPTPSPPPNDNFASSQVIGGCSGSVTGTNFAATQEAGEPVNPDSPGSTRSVWYQWQAPSTSNVTIDTIGSDFDTVLAIYTGSSLGGLTLVANNDDIVLNTNVVSSVTFSVTQGQIYRIAVNGYNNQGSGGDPGNIKLNWTETSCTQSSSNPIDGVDFFVTQQYLDFLGRLPDAGGFANWVATLNNCPNGGFGEFANPQCDRVHVSAGFYQSVEFQDRGYFAYRFYEVGLGRRPLYKEFIPDMALVGGSQSPAQSDASKAAFTSAFVLRPEFVAKYPGLSGQPLANALWVTAGLPGSPINAGSMTNGQILRAIAETQLAFDKFLNRGFVSMEYFGYLQRDPDSIGFQNWVDTLNADPNNFRHMIFGFIYSDEYRHRFGP